MNRFVTGGRAHENVWNVTKVGNGRFLNGVKDVDQSVTHPLIRLTFHIDPAWQLDWRIVDYFVGDVVCNVWEDVDPSF